QVMAGDREPEAARHPGEVRSLLDLRDLPDGRPQLRLPQPGAGADDERAAFEALDAGHRRRPVRPAFDVSEYRPDALRRRFDFDGGAERFHAGPGYAEILSSLAAFPPRIATRSASLSAL